MFIQGLILLAACTAGKQANGRSEEVGLVEDDDFDETWESYADDANEGTGELFLEEESRLLETLGSTDLPIVTSTYMYEIVSTAIVRDMGQVLRRV